jgi:hypothetical protein
MFELREALQQAAKFVECGRFGQNGEFANTLVGGAQFLFIEICKPQCPTAPTVYALSKT